MNNEYDNAGEGEFAIGMGSEIPYQNATNIEQAIDGNISELHSLRDSLRQSYLARIDECITECQGTIAECRDCLTGKIDVNIDKINAIKNTLERKLFDRIDNNIQQAVGYAVAAMEIDRGNNTIPIDTIDVGPTSPTPTIQLGGSTAGGLNTGDLPTSFPDTGNTTGGKCVITDAMCRQESGKIGTGVPYEFWHAGILKEGPNAGNIGCVAEKAGGLEFSIACADDTSKQTKSDNKDCIKVCLVEPPKPDTPPPPPPEPTNDKCQVDLPDSLADLDIQAGEFVLTDDWNKLTPAQQADYSKWSEDQFNASQKCNEQQQQAAQGTFTAFCDPCNISSQIDESFTQLSSVLSTLAEGASPASMASKIFNIMTYGFFSDVVPNTESIAKAAYKVTFDTVSEIFGTVINTIPPPAGCDTNKYNLAAGRLMVPQFLSKYLGSVPEPTLNSLRQQLNYVCQTGILDSGTATDLKVRSGLTKTEWEDCLKLNGDCPGWFQRVVDNNENKVTPDVALAMWRRNLIDEDELHRQFKVNGFCDDEGEHKYWEAWKKVTEQLPNYADLIRLMVRDSFDEQVVQENEYDTDFDKKFIGKAKEWACNQGIPEEVFKYLWRAHWEIPSPTQFYEMLARLRPDANATTPDGKSVTVTADQVRTALQVNDMAPKWIDALMAISTLPLNSTDIRRGYTIGTIKKEELVDLYQNARYDKKNAEKLRDFTVKDAANQKARLSGQADETELTQLFVNGVIQEDHYRIQLLNLDYDSEFVENAVRRAKQRIQANHTTSIYKAVRSSYLNWRTNSDEYLNALISAGVDRDQIPMIVQRDTLIRNSKHKEIALSKMCKLVDQGYLSVGEYLNRAINMNYAPDRAMLLVQSCVTDIVVKRKKILEQEMLKAQRKADKMAAHDRKMERLRRQEYRERYPYKLPAKKVAPEGVYVPVSANDNPEYSNSQ